MSIRVKICGLTREEDLTEAINAGADAVGFIVGIPSSPRNLTLKEAAFLINQVPSFVDSVVVTAPNSVEWLITICTKLNPNILQIHGKEQIDLSKIKESREDIRIIKTIYVTHDNLNQRIIKDLKEWDAVLLDSYSKGHYGGTGKVHDWALSRQIKDVIAPVPVILAGGLNPENVKDAILKVKPFAVDVASGVEASPGIKDHSKIRAFIQNAKKIDERTGNKVQ